MTSSTPAEPPAPEPAQAASERPTLGPLAVARFASELALLAALAYLGSRVGTPATLSTVASLALPVAAALTWGRWVAPKSARRLRDPWRLLLELVLFLPTSTALFVTGHWVGALALLGLYAAGAGHRRTGG